MSNQIQNLKSPIIKKKIKNLSILFFSLVLTLAVFSQINSAAKPKPTYDVGFNKADWLYYKSNNDLTAYLGKKSSTLPTVRYQKGGDYLEFSLNQAIIGNQETSISSTSSVSLETNVKQPNTPTLFYRNILDGVDANYQITNIPFKIKEEIILKSQISNLKSKNSTFLFDAETTGKPIKQKDGSIAFFDENDNYLFNLEKPFMIDGKGMRSEEVSIDIKEVQIPRPQRRSATMAGQSSIEKTKIAPEGTIFGDSNLERKSGLPPNSNKYSGIKSFVNNLKNNTVDNQKVLDLRGIEPPESWVAIQTPRQARPRTKLVYHKDNSKPQHYTITLSASSDWLNSPDRAYPVIIDPTVTHNADSNFTGQMNRVADADATSSTQLEAGYGEQSKDPYTVLLLHFNEASGSTSIKDYASTTRVITANGNASTTSATTRLGLGNSAAFDGTGDYLSLPDSTDWQFNNNDFTIDFWVNPTDLSVSRPVVDMRVTELGTGFLVEFVNSKVRMFGNNTAIINEANSSNTISINTWTHITITRTGNKIEDFINGVQDQSVNYSGTFNDHIASRIGASLYSGVYLNGYLDSLRILKGRALTPEEIKAAASRRPYAVYTSPVVEVVAPATSATWDTVNWTEGGVNTGNGEQPYNTSSLVAQWDFNDTSGATLTASSSGSCTTSCNGTLTNFAYTSSQDQATTTTGWTANNKKWGAGALMFDGSNDYVQLGNEVSLKPTVFTVEAWFNYASTTSYENIISMHYNDVTLNINPSRKLCGSMYTSGATCTNSTVSSGSWHYGVFTFDGSTTRIFLDGKEENSTSGSLTWEVGSSYPLRIGTNANGIEQAFSGALDSARIYSRVLSAAEILSNYNAGNVEIQTRTGATSDPNDGTWEAWKPTTGETQLLSMDSDAVNWHSDIMASTTIATSTDTVLKMEGTGSLKIEMGKASTTAGTVALWHFEETGTTTGTTLYDETANNNDATTTGTTVADGIFGKARKFNGSSGYVSAADSDNWNFGSGDFSIDFWVRYNNYNTDPMAIIANANPTTSSEGWLIYTQSNLLRFLYTTNGTTQIPLDNSWIPPSNTWYHVAVTRRSTNLDMFIDGKQLGTTKSISTDTIFNSTALLTIGARGATTPDLPINGNLDEVRILKGRAISADEIAETYRMGANHHLTRQVSAVDLSAQTKLPFWIAADRTGTFLEAMIGESDHSNYELASSTLALSTSTVLYIKGDEIASSTSIKDSSFSGKAITANGNARTSGNGKIGNSLYFDGTGDYFSILDNDDWTMPGDFTIDFWYKFDSINAGNTLISHNDSGSDSYYLQYYTASGGNIAFVVTTTSTIVNHVLPWSPSVGVWYHIALLRSVNNYTTYINGVAIGTTVDPDTMGNYNSLFEVGAVGPGNSPLAGNLDELRIIKGTALTADQIRQAYEYGLRAHPITIDFGATLQPSDLISNSTDYNFSITATTSGLSATTSGLYLGDKIIVKENLGGTEYAAQGTVNAINTTTGAITVPSWDTGSSFPSGNGYSPNATVFKWQREYFDITGAATTTRDAITNLTIRPTNGAGGRTVWLDDFRYNTNYLTASSSSAITSGNNRYLQYRAVFTSTDTFVSPFLSAFNTLYTALANSFPSLIGISGGGFLSF